MKHSLSSASSAKAKASRLRSARVLAGLTRKNIEAKFGISENTLRMWEHPKTEDATGLTVKGARRFVEVMNKAGVICTVEWLLHGAGESPKTYHEVSEKIVKPLQTTIDVPAVHWGEDEIILSEIETFCKVNPAPVILRISDDGMEPFLCRGDYVGGNKKAADEINKYLGTICIIGLTNHTRLCRRLETSHKGENLYNLACINPRATVDRPVLYDMSVKSVASVIWIRKKEGAQKSADSDAS